MFRLFVPCLLLAMLACSFHNPLGAQDFRPGYIITINGDSINGLVSYGAGKKNLATCSFKKDKRAKAEQYSPLELRAYGINEDKQFVSLALPDNSVPTSQVFARLVVHGPMELFRYRKLFFVRKDSLQALPLPQARMIETAQGNMSMEDKRYVAILNRLVADCHLSADKVVYSESDLSDLVKRYNLCKGFAPQHDSPRAMAKVNYALFTGFVQSKLRVYQFEDISFKPTNTVTGGFSLDFSSPRVFDRLFLSVEGWYLDAFYQGYTEGPYNGTFRRQDVIIEATSFKLPIGVRYNFSREGSSPYIKGGIITTLYQDLKIKTIQERETLTGIIITDEVHGGYDTKKARGIWFSLGYDQRIAGKAKIFIELRYERVNAFIGTAVEKFSEMNNYAGLVGVRF